MMRELSPNEKKTPATNVLLRVISTTKTLHYSKQSYSFDVNAATAQFV